MAVVTILNTTWNNAILNSTARPVVFNKFTTWFFKAQIKIVNTNYTFSDLGANDVDATNLKFTFTNETDGKSVNKIAVATFSLMRN